MLRYLKITDCSFYSATPSEKYFLIEHRWQQRYQSSPILSAPKAAIESTKEPEITCQYKEVEFISSKELSDQARPMYL